MVLLRHEIGDVMRDLRVKQGMTLRDLAARSNVSLSYLSELERGQKEASSEILQSIADAMSVPLSQFIIEAGDRLALFEDLHPSVDVPDVVPDYFYAKQGI